MNYRRYYQNSISPDLLGGTGKPYPMIYFKVQPEIERECNVLESKGINRLTPDIVKQSVNNIYNNTNNKYPDLAKYANEYEKNAPYATTDLRTYGVEAQFAGLFLGLIALLFLAEFASRRRRIRRRY